MTANNVVKELEKLAKRPVLLKILIAAIKYSPDTPFPKSLLANKCKMSKQTYFKVFDELVTYGFFKKVKTATRDLYQVNLNNPLIKCLLAGGKFNEQ